MGKTRGMGAARKLKDHRRRQRWADKAYKKSNLGNEWKKPFAGSSHAKGIVLEKIGIEAKQPNSAIRKCARVQLIKNGKKIAAFVPNDGCLNYIEENVSQIYPSCLHHLTLFETSLLISFNLIL
ncbi:40S ribosomal protein S23 [Linum perenne]